MSRCLAIAFPSRARNARTSSLALAARRSESPDSSSSSRPRIWSIASCWLLPALRNCRFSRSATIVVSRSSSLLSRAFSKAARSAAERRGSVVESRSARRRNDRSRSAYCRRRSSSRCRSTAAASTASAAPADCQGPRPATTAATIVRQPSSRRRARPAFTQRRHAAPPPARLMVAPVPRGPAASAFRWSRPGSVPASGARRAAAR